MIFINGAFSRECSPSIQLEAFDDSLPFQKHVLQITMKYNTLQNSVRVAFQWWGVNNFVDLIKHRLNLHVPGGNKTLGEFSELLNYARIVWK